MEENHFKGKQAILQNCEQVGAYFKSVTTDFKTFNVTITTKFKELPLIAFKQINQNESISLKLCSN